MVDMITDETNINLGYWFDHSINHHIDLIAVQQLFKNFPETFRPNTYVHDVAMLPLFTLISKIKCHC
jgi:hypothetical protein